MVHFAACPSDATADVERQTCRCSQYLGYYPANNTCICKDVFSPQVLTMYGGSYQCVCPSHDQYVFRDGANENTCKTCPEHAVVHPEIPTKCVCGNGYEMQGDACVCTGVTDEKTGICTPGRVSACPVQCNPDQICDASGKCVCSDAYCSDTGKSYGSMGWCLDEKGCECRSPTVWKTDAKSPQCNCPGDERNFKNKEGGLECCPVDSTYNMDLAECVCEDPRAAVSGSELGARDCKSCEYAADSTGEADGGSRCKCRAGYQFDRDNWKCIVDASAQTCTGSSKFWDTTAKKCISKSYSMLLLPRVCACISLLDIPRCVWFAVQRAQSKPQRTRGRRGATVRTTLDTSP
jgi:hypothetical protein